MGLNFDLLAIVCKLLDVDHLALDHRLLRRGAVESAGSDRRRRLAHAQAGCWVVARIVPITGAAGSSWEEQGARKAAALEGLGQGYGAGHVGGACHAKGDQCPLLWCAWWSSAFCCFCSFCSRGGCNICTFRNGAIVPEVATIVLEVFPQPYIRVPCTFRPPKPYDIAKKKR